jgi:SsrA-binding protein
MEVKNKKAYFEFEILEKFVAGMVLMGSEIKSIRDGRINIQEAHCYFRKKELWVKNMNIGIYEQAAHNGHEAIRERKLLLNKKELKKLLEKTREKGLAIMPLRLFLSGRGWVKLEIGLAKGKKIHDKRNTIKDRESKRELDRIKKLKG